MVTNNFKKWLIASINNDKSGASTVSISPEIHKLIKTDGTRPSGTSGNICIYTTATDASTKGFASTNVSIFGKWELVVGGGTEQPKPSDYCLASKNTSSSIIKEFIMSPMIDSDGNPIMRMLITLSRSPSASSSATFTINEFGFEKEFRNGSSSTAGNFLMVREVLKEPIILTSTNPYAQITYDIIM